jgi:hypothetical protein
MKNKEVEVSGGDIPNTGSRGAIIRLFGVFLVILGTLDIMLSWRGAFAIVPFHVMLIAAGLLLCLIGAIRRQNQT